MLKDSKNLQKWLFPLFLFLKGYAGISDHYQKLEETEIGSGVQGIDSIYLINLDQRPEKLQNCLRQLRSYQIIPKRVSAIYGWTLPAEVLNDIGLKFDYWMWPGNEYVIHFSPERGGNSQFVQLNPGSYGQPFFSKETTKGAIGCTLSHLSALNDAYNAGYETIWIMEDDIVILENPHKLSQLIEELDFLIEDWDLLYTDYDLLVLDPTRSVASQFPMMWRPDMPFLDLEFLRIHTDINEHFLKVGNRLRAHSIIYRRSGLKKILNFYKNCDMFLPYDNELSLIPDIQLYVVKKHIVSYREITSDTRHRNF